MILEDHIQSDAYVEFDDETSLITRIGSMNESLMHLPNAIDCTGFYVSPGFIDTHTHGGGGCDFMDGDVESILTAAHLHLHHGTTTIFPTTLTSSNEDLFLCIDNFKKARGITENMPHLAGMHLEGPYFSPTEKGAQNEDYIRTPSPEDYMHTQTAASAAGPLRRNCLEPWKWVTV